MNFRDPKLEAHVTRVSQRMTSLPELERPVCALLDAWQHFALTEGADSPRAREALAHLLAPDLRPALQSWYRRIGDDMNPGVLEFRDHLSRLTGETFG